jgi:hypothetical protein
VQAITPRKSRIELSSESPSQSKTEFKDNGDINSPPKTKIKPAKTPAQVIEATIHIEQENSRTVPLPVANGTSPHSLPVVGDTTPGGELELTNHKPHKTLDTKTEHASPVSVNGHVPNGDVHKTVNGGVNGRLVNGGVKRHKVDISELSPKQPHPKLQQYRYSFEDTEPGRIKAPKLQNDRKSKSADIESPHSECHNNKGFDNLAFEVWGTQECG